MCDSHTLQSNVVGMSYLYGEHLLRITQKQLETNTYGTSYFGRGHCFQHDHWMMPLKCKIHLKDRLTIQSMINKILQTSYICYSSH